MHRFCLPTDLFPDDILRRNCRILMKLSCYIYNPSLSHKFDAQLNSRIFHVSMAIWFADGFSAISFKEILDLDETYLVYLIFMKLLQSLYNPVSLSVKATHPFPWNSCTLTTHRLFLEFLICFCPVGVFFLYVDWVSDSESTDPVSIEDTEEDDDSASIPSNPTTPCDDVGLKTPDRVRHTTLVNLAHHYRVEKTLITTMLCVDVR